MKKRMHTLIHLILVIMLVVSMAIPAMAVPHTGTGNSGTISFVWSVECEETVGTATISISPSVSPVTACVKNNLYNKLNNVSGTSEDKDTGFASVTATADNTVIYDGYSFINSEILSTFGSFMINSTVVAENVYDYPG